MNEILKKNKKQNNKTKFKYPICFFFFKKRGNWKKKKKEKKGKKKDNKTLNNLKRKRMKFMFSFFKLFFYTNLYIQKVTFKIHLKLQKKKKN